MAAQHSPYTNLNYEQDINQKKRDWNSIPKLEDLPKDHKLVQSFSEGRLRLSPPLIFTQAGRRSFDGQFLGAALLGELLPSDVVYWLELPPEPCNSRMRSRSFKANGKSKEFRKLEAAQEFYFRAFCQLPNAFYVASGRDADQHDTWLRDSSPCARHQQRNAGASNLASGAVGMPIRILYDPIAREEWLLDGESDPSTGCQHIIMLGQNVYAGSLERIWKLPRRRFVRTITRFITKGCQKSYFAFDSRDLAKEFQSNTPQELAATLRDLDLTGNGEALVTWRDVREIMARLRRLYHILDRFKEKNIRRADWRLPENLQALVQKAEDIMQQLESGPLKLGREVPRGGERSIIITKERIPKATPDGVKAEAMMEQVLSNRRAGRGQGRKRLRSDAEDSEEEWWRPRQNPLRLKTDNSEKSGKIEDPKLESE